MTPEAYELLTKILKDRVEVYAEREPSTAFTYRNVLDMLQYAQANDLETLRQYDYN